MLFRSLRWLEPLAKPKRVYLVHGEPRPAESLAAALRTTRGWDVTIPDLGESHELT